MDIEFLDFYSNYGDYSVEVRAKVDGKMRYFDIRVKNNNLKFTIDRVGIAANKNKNYKFIDSMNNEYRYIKGVERLNRVREDIKKAVPKEILLFALDTVASRVEIEDDWILA